MSASSGCSSRQHLPLLVDEDELEGVVLLAARLD